MRSYNLITALAFAATTSFAHPTANTKLETHALARPAALGPSLEEFLAGSTDITLMSRQANSTSPSKPNAGVKLCTEPAFGGECTHSVWPVNQCIDLMGYRGETKSFLPDDGFECLLMQGQCDASDQYIEVGDSDTTIAGDLTTLNWIADSTSYICFTEIAMLQRFVRVARLRTMAKANSS